jgi:hypothetical protein
MRGCIRLVCFEIVNISLTYRQIGDWKFDITFETDSELIYPLLLLLPDEELLFRKACAPSTGKPVATVPVAGGSCPEAASEARLESELDTSPDRSCVALSDVRCEGMKLAA